MSRSVDFEMYVIRVIAMSPMLLVMLVGVVIAIKRLPRHPRASWALIAALVLAGFNTLILPLAMQMFFQAFNSFQSTNELWLRTLIFTIPPMIVGSISWGLIFFAVFDRPEMTKFLSEDDPDRDVLDR